MPILMLDDATRHGPPYDGGELKGKGRDAGATYFR
jgi:hypothetical protein